MNISYKISSLKTSQFVIFPEKYTNGEEVAVSAYFQFLHKNDCSHIICLATIEYCQGDNLLMKSVLENGFDIDATAAKQILDSKAIPVSFLRYMATIAVGAMRGIIHSKTEGTVLNPIVLPPINLVDIIKEDAKIG